MDENSRNNDFESKKDLPNDFFEKFQNKLADSLDGFEIPEYLDESALDFLVKTKKPEVPMGYFEKSKRSILEQVEEEKVVQFRPRRLLFVASSIAAILIIGLLVFPFLNNNQVEPNNEVVIAEETTVTEEDEMDEYLAFIDESTLYDFYLEETDSEDEAEEVEIVEEDPEITEEEDAILDYIGEDFEDIYFDL